MEMEKSEREGERERARARESNDKELARWKQASGGGEAF
jgi:hypothetical protein